MDLDNTSTFAGCMILLLFIFRTLTMILFTEAVAIAALYALGITSGWFFVGATIGAAFLALSIAYLPAHKR